MSGTPGRSALFLRYRNPFLHKARRRSDSGCVSAFRLDPRAAAEARSELGAKPLYRGVRAIDLGAFADVFA
jgi:hypothetical protein